MSNIKVDNILPSQMPMVVVDGITVVESFVAVTGQVNFSLSKFTNQSQMRVFVESQEATWSWVNTNTFKISAPGIPVGSKVRAYRVLGDLGYRSTSDIFLGTTGNDTQRGMTQKATSDAVAAAKNRSSHTGTQDVSTITGLGFAATAPVTGGGTTVLLNGAGGWLGRANAASYIENYPQSFNESISNIYRREGFNGVVSPYSASLHIAAHDTWGRIRFSYNTEQVWCQGGVATSGSGWTVELYHNKNVNVDPNSGYLRTKNITTSVVTEAPSTGKEYNRKDGAWVEAQGGGGVVKYSSLPDNATTMIPVPGECFRMTRTNNSALTLTMTCTPQANVLKSWHVIVSRGTGSSIANFVPTFRTSGLSVSTVAWSGGGNNTPTISGVSHVLIMFYQIDQSVRAMIIDGW